jgi:ribose 5-phosphate isomerase B
MKVALGADHAGFLLKEQIRANLEAQGVEVHDFGTASQESTDYPDYAAKVAREVAAGHFDRGILVCSTGVGMSIAANKVEGIRAALGVNVEEVALTRGHNDANVLTLGEKYTSPEVAAEMVNVFLNTPFDGGRHQRRVDKITALETKSMNPSPEQK